MLDLKTMKSALEQLETERKIPREKIIDAIEQALAAAYKKDYGKKGQIIRATIDIETGKMEFYQIKIVVDESIVRMTTEDEEEEIAEDDDRVRFNEEHHILLSDAKKIKSDAKLEEEIIFPLEAQEDYGRIAAQTAKQVIIQKIREAERGRYYRPSTEVQEGEIVNWLRSEKLSVAIVYHGLSIVQQELSHLPEEQIPGESISSWGDESVHILYCS
jgi:N utilization substance protein A